MRDCQISRLFADVVCPKLVSQIRCFEKKEEKWQKIGKVIEDMKNEAVERNVLQTIRNLMETLKLSAE